MGSFWNDFVSILNRLLECLGLIFQETLQGFIMTESDSIQKLFVPQLPSPFRPNFRAFVRSQDNQVIRDFCQIHADHRKPALLSQMKGERAKNVVVKFVADDTVRDCGEIMRGSNQACTIVVSLGCKRVYGVNFGESQGLEKVADFA